MISIITESNLDDCMITLELAGNEIELKFKDKHFEALLNFADRQNYQTERKLRNYGSHIKSP